MSEKLKKLMFLPVLIVAGFASKYYTGPLSFWVNNSLGGIFYVLFWCLFFDLILSAAKPVQNKSLICIFVWGVTSALEFLQLVQTPLLTQWRSVYLGRILLGNTFTPSDFIYYFAGALLAWILLKKIHAD